MFAIGSVRVVAGDNDHALQFAEQLLELIDTTKMTTTYKLAVMLCLCDAVEDHTKANGDPPVELSGKEIAGRVVELYWPQTITYAPLVGDEIVLSQSPVNDIPRRLAEWRARHRLSDHSTVNDAREVDPPGWEAMYTAMEAQVLGQPLAKLQRFGDGRTSDERRFIYDFSWREEVAEATVARSGFDDTLRLRDGVGEWLVRFGPLVRPLVRTRFVSRVADRNRDELGQADLEEFLFGASRISLDRVRVPLTVAQNGCCFYCGSSLNTDQIEVDHFLPWSRRPDNHMDNLVASHRRCNGAKSASFAGTPHLTRWLSRFEPSTEEFTAIEEARKSANWPRNREWTRAKALASYLWLPPESQLWLRGRDYEAADIPHLRQILLAAA